MCDITSFTLQDMTRCGAALRGMGAGAASMEAAAERSVRFLDGHLRDGAGAKACVLTRLFITRRYGDLDGVG